MQTTDSLCHAPDFSFEQACFDAGHQLVAGVDEAGRGPWAGPVVAAAVILDPANIPSGLNDSKKLNEAKRNDLFDKIITQADFAIGIVSAAEIDNINILQATMKAMTRAVKGLPRQPAMALIDGNKTPPLDCACQAIKKGDARSLSIAAASIIAKVTRDRLMAKLDQQFPGYGFARHKGYGTAIHSQALVRLGPCREHRKSFAPIKKLLNDSQ